jgi:hypothetical protein
METMPPKPFSPVAAVSQPRQRLTLSEDEKEYRRAKRRKMNRRQHRTYNKAHYRAHIERHLVSAAKQRAKRKGVPFTITAADVRIPAQCPILGIPLFSKRGKGPGAGPNSPTIDRIIPALGYVKENIVVISHKANTIKTNAEPEQILRVGQFSVLLRQNLRFAYPGYKLPTK